MSGWNGLVVSRSRRSRRGVRPFLRLSALSALLVVTGCGGDSPPTQPVTPSPSARPTLPSTYRASGRAAAGDVFVHLFEWRWSDIASECESVLGPAGYKAVQVSPPQEHSITPTFDWSERYQPVSYSIDRSRSGTRGEFVAMVNRCKAVGVDIYVDAVINHMTNWPSPGVGSNGTAYSKYSYPGLYTPADFHTPCGITSYQRAAEVQDCELLSLPDLNTGLASVRAKIADYLLMLARLGVAGFRIDAAKHIQQVQLDLILGLVDSTLVAEGRPRAYWFLEVIGGGNEALTPSDYFGAAYRTGGAADITEFIFVGVANKFRGVNGERISQLNPNGTPGNQFSPSAWGIMPSDKAVVFLQNHDTQHACGLGYRSPQVFRLANVWMLAQPYGYPTILSSYGFDCPSGNSTGPRSDAAGWTLPVSCVSSMEAVRLGDWVCEHRDPYIRNMVRFRRTVAGTSITKWWDDGANAIAFSRGDRGFVAINRATDTKVVTVPTDLAPGTYCEVIGGGRSGGTCVGGRVTVEASGTIALSLPANSAIAIDVTSRL